MDGRRGRETEGVEGRLQTTVLTSDQLSLSQRQELLSLCSRAYKEDFAPYFELLRPAVHLVGALNGQVITHCAWVERELRVAAVGALRTAYVEAVATIPEFQRRGLATRLLAAIPSLIGDFELAALSPSDETFYARLGWETWRGPLAYRARDGSEIETPDETVMIYRLPRTPSNLDLTARLSTDWRPLEVW